MIRTINILGTDYTVKIVKMGKDDYGDCNTDKKVIRLNRQKDQKSESLVHEVIHGALHESGLNHVLHATEGLEEAIVRAVEHGLRTAGLIPEFDFEPEEEEEEERAEDGEAD